MREALLVSFLVGFVWTAAPHQQFLDFWGDLDDFVSDLVHPRYRIAPKWRKRIANKYRHSKNIVQLYKNEGDCGSTFEYVEMHAFDEMKTPGENIELLGVMIENWIQGAFFNSPSISSIRRLQNSFFLKMRGGLKNAYTVICLR